MPPRITFTRWRRAATFAATVAAVGAIAVGEITTVGAAGTGVAVADEPQASMAASSSVKGPRIIILGFFNQ